MKLWVVTHGAHDDEIPVGVYSTEEAANAAANINCPPKAGDVEYGNWCMTYSTIDSAVYEFDLDASPEPAYSHAGPQVWTAERLAKWDALRIPREAHA